MTLEEFRTLLDACTRPVVLLEGTRELPDGTAPVLSAFAERLARAFPHASFRTGNAKGSDEAFAAGVAAVDPRRISFVLPYSGHRKGQRPAESPAMSMDDVSGTWVGEVVDQTLRASPQYERVAVNYRTAKTHPRQRATAQLILRDTLKVTGSDTIPAPVAGIFFAHSADPDRGGTGHTMRVCRARGVPVVTQSQWMKWDL